jgi:hypothetical protein
LLLHTQRGKASQCVEATPAAGDDRPFLPHKTGFSDLPVTR